MQIVYEGNAEIRDMCHDANFVVTGGCHDAKPMPPATTHLTS